MLAHTTFSLANVDVEQALAFIGITISYIAFFVWVVWLIRW